MSSRKEQRPQWSKSRFDPFEIRKSHRASSLQVRKQKRNDRFRQRRGIQLTAEEQSTLLLACASGVMSFLQESSTDLHEILGKHPPTTGLFLGRFLQERETESRAFADRLMSLLQQQSTTSCHYALSIVKEMTQALCEDNTQQGAGTSDDYYRRPPLRWEDLFFRSHSSMDIISILANLLHTSPADPQHQSIISLATQCWMNFAEYAPQATVQASVPTHWALLVSHLPTSAACCAALLRHDHVHYGMDLLLLNTPPTGSNLVQFDWPRLVPSPEGASLLEGLTRREPAVSAYLCQDVTLVQAICTHVATQPILLRVMYHILANDTTRNAPLLFQSAVKGVLAQLEHHREVDAVPVLRLLQGKEAIPKLMHILSSNSMLPHVYKVEAIHSLGQDNNNHHDDVVEYYTAQSDEAKDDMMKAFVQLLKVNDTAQASLAVLDSLLRRIPECQELFISHDGVDILERFSLRPETDSSLSNVAGKLVDDLFDDENEYAVPSGTNAVESFSPYSFTPPQGRGRGRTIPAWQQQQP